jgi:hypothetical protein
MVGSPAVCPWFAGVLPAVILLAINAAQKKVIYWRLAMPKKRQFKSDAFEAIHSGAKGLFQAGGIDKTTMREFDESYFLVSPKPTRIISPSTL